MAKRKNSVRKPERRPRHEIDRNYFIGDLLIKTGTACGIALGAVAAYTPFSLGDAIRDGMVGYLAVMVTFGLIGLSAFLYGRHLRREATHWDFD